MPPTPFRLRLTNYKGIASLDWSPTGVSVLVGPTRSGKTTTLWCLELLRLAFESSFDTALRFVGGTGTLRRFEAPPTEACEIEMQVGAVSWTVRPERATRLWERIRSAKGEVVIREAGSDAINVEGLPIVAHDDMAMKRAWQLGGSVSMQLDDFVDVLRHYRVYAEYDLRSLREIGSRASTDVRLDWNGGNAFSVLREWRVKTEHEEKWLFVRNNLREMFPGVLSLDFSGASVVTAEAVSASGYKAPPSDWSNGFFAALLSLAAVASAPEGAVVAFDEPETSLHPKLIVMLMEAFREWSAEKHVTVILTTHSPVVLDCFKDAPEQVFVMEPGLEPLPLPVPLTKLKGPEWTQHFSIGDMYSHLEVGAPRKA